MHSSLHPLTAQFLSWLDEEPRTYAATMAAWRSHCPRYLVWEDALADGLVRVQPAAPGDLVLLTAAGQAALATPARR